MKVVSIVASVIVVLGFLVWLIREVREVLKVGQLVRWYRAIVAEHARNESRSNAGAELKKLLEHVKHHADEGMEEGVDVRWLASMGNLVELIRRYKALPAPSVDLNLERLFVHWVSDPKRMTPPPRGYLLSHAKEVVGASGSAEKISDSRTRDPERYVGVE